MIGGRIPLLQTTDFPAKSKKFIVVHFLIHEGRDSSVAEINIT